MTINDYKNQCKALLNLLELKDKEIKELTELIKKQNDELFKYRVEEVKRCKQ